MPQKVNQVVNFQISTFAEIFSSLCFFAKIISACSGYVILIALL